MDLSMGHLIAGTRARNPVINFPVQQFASAFRTTSTSGSSGINRLTSQSEADELPGKQRKFGLLV
jgi:hypothetical protein